MPLFVSVRLHLTLQTATLLCSSVSASSHHRGAGSQLRHGERHSTREHTSEPSYRYVTHTHITPFCQQQVHVHHIQPLTPKDNLSWTLMEAPLCTTLQTVSNQSVARLFRLSSRWHTLFSRPNLWNTKVLHEFIKEISRAGWLYKRKLNIRIGNMA